MTYLIYNFKANPNTAHGSITAKNTQEKLKK